MKQIGEDPDREGLRRTPERFEKALRFLTSGYQQDAEKLLNGAMFNVCYDEMVVVKDIEVFSLCEHHLLPFFGKCHVAYIPDKKVVGLSKIPRLVNMFSRRLQIQERLTSADRRGDSNQHPSAGCRGGDRSAALVHGDARRGKTALRSRDQRHAGRIPRKPANARGISLLDQPPHAVKAAARYGASGRGLAKICFRALRERVLGYAGRREHEKEQRKGTTERRLERSQVSVDRAVPDPRKGHGLARSADRVTERAHHLPDFASEVAYEGPCVAART